MRHRKLIIVAALIGCGSVFAVQSGVDDFVDAPTRSVGIFRDAGGIAEPLSELEKRAVKPKALESYEWYERRNEFVPPIYDSKKELQVFALGNDIKAKLLKRSRMYKALAHKIDSVEDRNLQTINPETIGKHLNLLAAFLHAFKTTISIEPLDYALLRINMLRQMHGDILIEGTLGVAGARAKSAKPEGGSDAE